MKNLKKKSSQTGLLQTLKENDLISFDLIKNAKGEEHYKDDFISIDLENIEEEAKSGYYDGVEISIYDGASIENLDELIKDKKSWDFTLPISKVHLQGLQYNQFKKFVELIGAGITEMSIILESDELNTQPLLNACPKIEKLDIESWSELKIELNGLENLKLNSFRISSPSVSSKKVDLMNSTIKELNWNAKVGQLSLPKNLISLEMGTNLAGTKLNWKELSKLESLNLTVTDESNDDLTFFKELKSLLNLELNISGYPSKGKPQIQMPPSLQSLNLNTTSQDVVSVDLSFLESCKELRSLVLRTDVGNGGKGFLEFDKLKCLTNLETLEIEENAMGTSGYKSDFSASCLTSLSKLKKLSLKSMMNIDDLVGFKGLASLEELKLIESRIISLKGISFLLKLSTLEMVDCHSICDFKHLSENSIKKFVFSIGSYWGTEVKLKKEHILEFNDLNIDESTFDIDKWKFVKKDFKELTKKFELETDGTTLNLLIKK